MITLTNFALLVALLLPRCNTKNEAADKPSTASPASTSHADTQRQADDKATGVVEASNNAKVEAATAQTAVDTKLTAAHDETGARLQKEFDVADRRFNGLKQRADKASGATKQRADAAVAKVTTLETTMMADIAKLRDATGPAWDTTRTQIYVQAAALTKAIDSLEVALK